MTPRARTEQEEDAVRQRLIVAGRARGKERAHAARGEIAAGFRKQFAMLPHDHRIVGKIRAVDDRFMRQRMIGRHRQRIAFAEQGFAA